MQATMHQRRWLITLIGLMGLSMAILSLSAHAIDRSFPPATLRGNMTITAYPTIVMDQTKIQLSPGSRIWGQNHLTQIPVSLGSSSYLVNYTKNVQGDVDRVWILTPDEAKQPIENQRSNLKW
ncbi:hypothetical protein ACVBEF_17995 [Glaciimonas sp. GG7]